MKVKDCMCGEVCCVKPETNISEIAKLMEKNHIGCVPVCDNKDCIVGVITDRDIILRSVACDKDLKTTKASEIMTCNVCNKFVDSDINETIPHIINPIIIENTIINIIIDDIFLVIFVFFIKYFIAGSTINEIMNAIKNGI